MSRVGLIQRVEKTPDNEHGVKSVKAIPGDEVCVLYLGGNDTKDEQAASGNVKVVEVDVSPRLSTPVPLYSAYYDVYTGNMYLDWIANYSKYGYDFTAPHDDDNFLWINEHNINNVFNTKILPRLFDENGRLLEVKKSKEKFDNLHIVFQGNFFGLRNRLNQMLYAVLTKSGMGIKDTVGITKTVVTNSMPAQDMEFDYINKLFEQTIAPRISERGHRLSLRDAMARVRKLNIVAHCHGTFVLHKMEEKMHTRMRDLGYSETEIDMVCSQMLVVAHAPIIPLGISKFRIVSFTTAYDLDAMRPSNWVTEYVQAKLNQEGKGEIDSDWLEPCFLAGRNGDVFLIHNAFEPSATGAPHDGEHRSTRYLPVKGQTYEGKIMNTIAGNVLRNGIENSLSETFTELPPIRELVVGDNDQDGMRALFDLLEFNGQLFMSDVRDFVHDRYEKGNVHVQEMRAKRPIPRMTELKR